MSQPSTRCWAALPDPARDRPGRGRPRAAVLGRALRAGAAPWYCTASPIHDPHTGELLGIIDVSGPALTLHPAIGALVDTVRRLAEAQLWRHHEQRMERLRQCAAPVLATTHGPVLLVDEHGWVAHSSGVAVTGRIAVPSPDHVLTVPGLGVCRPEPLADGWLIRPSEASDVQNPGRIGDLGEQAQR